MPCDISFAALILAFSSSALAVASSFTRFMSGLAGRTLLLLLPLLPGGGLGSFLLPVTFPAFPANGTRMCHSEHVALGIFPLPWSATRQTLV
jgi:hypothetical protein